MIGLESILNTAVQRATGSTASSSGNSAGASMNATQSFLDQGNFFELLTAQLSHQDPLSPASSTQFMSELAQLSTASGIRSLSQTVSGFGQEQQTNLRLRAAALVGHSVGLSGNTLTLPSSGGANGAFSLPANASQVNVTVTNGSGAVVGQIALGPQDQGVHEFKWPGKGNAPGNYTFTVQAVDGSGVPLQTQTITLAKVASVQVSSSGAVYLAFDGRGGTMPLDQVTTIF